MTIYFEEEGQITLPEDIQPEALAEKVAETVLDDLECPYEAQFNLLLTENEQIHQMNEEFRGIDRPTDVLSFPMVNYDEPADFDILEDALDAFDPESGELLLGDIVISKEKVLEQAEEYGHSVLREFSFLIAHSVLHLCGYDHIQEADRVVMEEKQKAILDKLNIVR